MAACVSFKLKNTDSSSIMKNVVFYPNTDFNFVPPATHPGYTIHSAIITDKILTIDFSYKGGCSDHGFDLMFNGRYMKSMPMKASLYLIHETTDSCEEDLRQQFRYDLSKLLPENQKKLIIKLYGYDLNLVLEE